MGTLSAPVKALSDQLKLNPLDVKPAPAPGLPVDPGEIKPEGNTQPQGVKSGLQPLGVGTLAVQPLQAPQSALPASLHTLNPLDVKGPGSSLPNVLGAETVQRPQGGTVTTQSIIVNPVEPSTEAPSDVYGASNTDGAYQQGATGNYTYDDQYTSSTNTDYTNDMTAMGTDADYYASANEMATMNASSMENVSAGPQLGGDVKDNVRAAYAQRGLSWTPDSDITASEVNSAVEANLAAREMGSTPSVVTGDVSVADPEQAAESAGARGYAFVPDEAVSELAESRTVQRRAEQAMAASSGEPVKVSYVPSAAVRTAAVRAGAVVVGGGGPEDLLADAIAVGTFFYSLYQYNKNAAYLASNGSGDSSNQRATNVQTGAAAGAPNPNGDKNKGSTQPTKKGSVKDAQLPTEGRIRYVPPQDWDPSNPLPRAKVGGRTGYVDRFGNVWIKGPSRTPGEAFEWDVQLSRQGKSQLGWASRDGSHLNVSLRGRITH